MKQSHPQQIQVVQRLQNITMHYISQSFRKDAPMKDQLLRATLAHAHGEIEKHKANVLVYLEHPAGIGEHSDITEAIGVELDKIARYHDQVEVINEYFK